MSHMRFRPAQHLPQTGPHRACQSVSSKTSICLHSPVRDLKLWLSRGDSRPRLAADGGQDPVSHCLQASVPGEPGITAACWREKYIQEVPLSVQEMALKVDLLITAPQHSNLFKAIFFIPHMHAYTRISFQDSGSFLGERIFVSK